MASSARKRKHRQATLWVVMLLVVAHFGLTAALEMGVPLIDSASFRQGERFLKRARAASPPVPSVGIFGSSRAACGIDPELLRTLSAESPGIEIETFNFARDATGQFFEWLMLERLAQRGALPDIAIVELVPAFLISPNEAGAGENVERSLLYPRELRELERRGWLPSAGHEKGSTTAETARSTLASTFSSPGFTIDTSFCCCAPTRWVDTTSDPSRPRTAAAISASSRDLRHLGLGSPRRAIQDETCIPLPRLPAENSR